MLRGFEALRLFLKSHMFLARQRRLRTFLRAVKELGEALEGFTLAPRHGRSCHRVRPQTTIPAPSNPTSLLRQGSRVVVMQRCERSTAGPTRFFATNNDALSAKNTN